MGKLPEQIERYLNTLIADYIKNKRDKCKQENCSLKSSFKNFGEMFKIISIGRIYRKNGWVRHNHQRRLKEINLKRFGRNISKRKREILKAKDFDELHSIINSYSVKGIGELTIYDIAFRIGTYLRKYPKKVYLHAGTRKGAKALGYDISRGYLCKKELHTKFPNFQLLRPYEIEDFLCVSHKKLEKKEDIIT